MSGRRGVMVGGRGVRLDNRLDAIRRQRPGSLRFECAGHFDRSESSNSAPKRQCSANSASAASVEL